MISASSTAHRMGIAARRLLNALDGPQRADASGTFDGDDFRDWTYLPGPRAGVRLGDLSAEQRTLALALLDSGCSPDAAITARGIIELDMIRRQLVVDADPDDHRFWIRVFGTISDRDPWAWRINGHHLAVQITVVGDRISCTPNFFGAEPALVLTGPHQGRRSLLPEEELARSLVEEFTPAQRGIVIGGDVAPDDIMTRADPVADPQVLPEGLAYGVMSATQRRLLEGLVRRYFDRAPLEHADLCWQDAASAGLDKINFSWLGSTDRGQGHYYAVHGPTFLLEYDNTQDDANHIHSVWRDLQNDWGGDVLRAHYGERHG